MSVVVIRAARIDREPLLLGAQPLAPVAQVLAIEAASALQREALSESDAASTSESDALHRVEHDRLQHESISAERQRVLERAREQGHQAGVEQGRAEYETRQQSMRALIGSMQDALAAGIHGAEEVIVEIAFEAVAKILGDALASRDAVQAVVREVVRGVREREQLIVRVSPRDHELLAGAGVLPKNGDAPRLEFVADERVELGGCLIETGGGTLDGRLETQLQRLRETLVGAWRMQAPEVA